ncbi:hypothetical protein [Aestuariivita boseongensis]|uniref:hypothetical protein n=1 Tax=Aestuariivita boseongensis TaxID=1470562 RepID=UPI00155D8926|nr:hypothetical protein [Aestuariivita boseongensis]
MAYLIKSYRSLDLVFELNWDRIIYVVVMALSLLAGLYVGSFAPQLSGFDFL